MDKLTQLFNRLIFDEEDDTQEAEMEEKRSYGCTKNKDIKLQTRRRSSVSHTRSWRAMKRRNSAPEQHDSTFQKEKIQSRWSELPLKEFMKKRLSPGIKEQNEMVDSKLSSIGNILSEEMQSFKMNAILSWRRFKRKRSSSRRASETYYRNKYSTPKKYTRSNSNPCFECRTSTSESDRESSMFDIVKRNVTPLLNMIQSGKETVQSKFAEEDSSRTDQAIREKYGAYKRSKSVSR